MSEEQPDSWASSMFLPLRRYGQFRGRSGRHEFWFYSLFLALGYLAIGAVGVALAAGDAAGESVGLVIGGGWMIFFIANFIPGLALTTRRLHDLGLSGAVLIAIFAALAFLNLIAWLGYLVVMTLPGQAKTNRWGPPVGARDIAEVFG